MKNIIKLALLASLSTSVLAENDKTLRERGHSVKEVVAKVLKNNPKEVETTDTFKNIFTDGKVTGQVEVMYSGHKVQNSPNEYATALGGHLMYELAEYKGFNAAVEFSMAHNINALTGEGDKENATLASSDGSYTELTRAYINYKYEALSIRLGRQLIDTPLADSDHIRIIDNTFEAAIINYELDNFSFMAGYLDRWQGTDTGLDVDSPWVDTGKNGTYFGGMSFSNDLLDISTWYYDISGENDASLDNVGNKSAYFDISLHSEFSKDFFFHSNAQYLHQSSQDSSEIKASIYGVLFEFVAYEKFSFSVAYNKSKKQSNKASFSGFGGGTLYTNMDSMVIDNITQDRDAQAIVSGITYKFNDVSFLYAYGNFDGNKDSLGQKEHIVEQNIGLEYTPSENLVIGAICVLSDNKETGGILDDYENYRVVVAYKF